MRRPCARCSGQALWRLRLNAEMLQAQGEAHHQQLQSTFLAAISHDLRTPLAAIVGAASALLTQRDKLAPSEQERLLRSIASEAAYLSTVTENTLAAGAPERPGADPCGATGKAWKRSWARCWRACASATPSRRIKSSVPEGLPLIKARSGAAGPADRQPAGQRAELQRGTDRAERERPCPRAGGMREGPRPRPERRPAGQPVCAPCARRPSGRARRRPGPGRVQGHRRGAWRTASRTGTAAAGAAGFRCCCPWKARNRPGRPHDACACWWSRTTAKSAP